MQVSLEIDAELFRNAEKIARRNGQPLSAFVEQLLRETLSRTPSGAAPAVYGQPWTEADADEAARISFAALDEDEKGATKG